MAQPKHPARALLEKYGVGKSVIGDRMLGRAAYGDAALTVPSPDGKSQHMVWAVKPGDLTGAATELLKRSGITNPTPEQLKGAMSELRAAGKAGGLEGAAAGLLKRSGIIDPTPVQLKGAMSELRAAGGDRYPDDDALTKQAMVQQNLAAQGRYQRPEAIEAFINQAKSDEQFRAEVAPYMGFSPAPEPAPVGKTPSPEIAAAATAPVASAPINPEVDNWWTASQPELKDIPVLGGLPRWGLAALGTGATAATVGLAYHQMAKGQQQSDPVAYAAASQAMNAY